MKILHLNEHLEWAGGVETYLLSIIPRLEVLGHPQAMVYAKGRKELVAGSHCVPGLSFGSRAAEREAFASLQNILEQEQPDLVHLHQVYNTGAIRACLERVPVVVHAHDYRYVCPASTFYYKRSREVCSRTAGPGCFSTTLLKHCLTPRPGFALDYYRRVRWFGQQAGRIAAVAAPSEAAAQRYRAAGFSDEQIGVHPYFSPLDAAEQPRKLPEQPTVLFVGRIRPTKGVDTFVEAFGKLPDSVRAIMIGDFTEHTRAQLQSQASRLGCATRLEMRGWVGRDDIREVYEQTTAFAFPSIWPETLGIVGIEALACGVPVVASDIGGVREWLLPGKTGLLTTPKSASELAHGLEKLLFDKDMNLEFGRNGIELIRQRFTPEYHIDRLVQTYRSALENGPAASAGGLH